MFTYQIKAAGAVPNSLSAQATIAGTNVFTGDTKHLSATRRWQHILILTSGSSMAVYISAPTSVSINDVGTTIGMTVFTAQAMYYQETNVQTTSVVI